MPLFAGVGVLGGLLRDLAPEPEEIWKFSPFFDLSVYRMLRKGQQPRTRLFHLAFLSTIVFAECLRWTRAVPVRSYRDFCAVRSRRASPVGAVCRVHYHAVRNHAAAEDLEQHPERRKARIAAAAAERSQTGGTDAADQSAFSFQHVELDRIPHPHRSGAGSDDDLPVVQHPPKPAQNAREPQYPARGDASSSTTTWESNWCVSETSFDS